MLERLKNSRVVRTGMAVAERYGRDNGQNVSGAIAFFGFLSLFPLLLAALSIVGFVLADNRALQDQWTDAIGGALPGIQDLVGRNLTRVVEVREWTGVLSFAGLLWTGRAVIVSAELGLSRIFGIRPKESFFKEHARRLGTTIALGTLALLGTGLTAAAGSLEAAGAAGIALGLAGVAFGLTVDFGLFIAAYRLLIVRPGPPWRALLPGALFVAIGWTALKFLGAWYTSRTLDRSATVYGPFAATAAILVILYLAGRLFVYGAELIVVLRDGKDGSRGGDDVERDDRAPAQAGAERSTVKIVTDVAQDVGTLVRKEVELAKQEITEGISARVKAVAALAVVGILGLFALGFMAAAAASALDNVLQPWASRLVVAGAFLLVAGLAFAFGARRMKRPPLAPVKTKETIKEDVEWAKAQLKR